MHVGNKVRNSGFGHVSLHFQADVMSVAAVPVQMSDAWRPTRRATSAWL